MPYALVLWIPRRNVLPTVFLLLDPRVDAESVAVPDVDGGSLDRLAGRGVHDLELQRQRGARLSFGDVAPKLLVREVVGAFRQLWGEDTRDRARRNAGRPCSFLCIRGALGEVDLRSTCRQGGGQKASELDERAAAGDATFVCVFKLVHRASVTLTPVGKL
jgi:hypothetical protein